MRSPPPTKRLRSSSVKVVPGSAQRAAISQQTSGRLRRATLAPLANGVVPTCVAGAAAPEQLTARSSRRTDQVTSPSCSNTNRQPASGRRRLQRRPATSSDGGTEGDAALGFAGLTLSEAPSSSDKPGASGPAKATRRARLLQQQIGCAALRLLRSCYVKCPRIHPTSAW